MCKLGLELAVCAPVDGVPVSPVDGAVLSPVDRAVLSPVDDDSNTC